MVKCCGSRPTDQNVHLDRALDYLAGNAKGVNPIGKAERRGAQDAQKHPFSNKLSAIWTGLVSSGVGVFAGSLINQLASPATRNGLIGMSVDDVCIPCSKSIHVLKNGLLGYASLFNQGQLIETCKKSDLKSFAECRLTNFLGDSIETASQYPFALASVCALISGCAVARQMQGAVNQEALADETIHANLKEKYKELADRLKDMAVFPNSANLAKDLASKILKRTKEIKTDLDKLRIPSHANRERVNEIVRPLFIAARTIQLREFSGRTYNEIFSQLNGG